MTDENQSINIINAKYFLSLQGFPAGVFFASEFLENRIRKNRQSIGHAVMLRLWEGMKKRFRHHSWMFSEALIPERVFIFNYFFN